MRFAKEPRWVAVLALSVAFAAAAVGLWSGLSLAPDFCDRLRDDAFYEFAWAANIASGRGAMVSDGVTTSGVQLLWSALLVPVAFCFGASSLPAVAPWLGFGFHVGAALAIARSGSGRHRFVRLCAALCWLGNPLLVRESQNGQETALACFLLVLLWGQRAASERRYGILALAAVFARTDLFGIVVGLSWLRGRRYGMRAAVTPVVVLALHFLACAALGGGVLADSAAPMAWLWHQNHLATLPTLLETLATYWWYLRPVLLGGAWEMASAAGIGLAVFALVRPWWPKTWRWIPLLSVASAVLLGVHDYAVAAFAAACLLLLPVPHRRRLPADLLVLFLGCAAILVLHWAVRWYPRDYYAAPLAVLGTVALLRFGHLRWIIVLFAGVQLSQVADIRPEPLLGQRMMAMAGLHLAEVLPPGERVGCFNSGLVTFGAAVLESDHAKRRGVVNLDGVVDARAFGALQKGRLSEWLDQQSIGYVLDNPVQFASDPGLAHANGHWFEEDFSAAAKLVEVARFVAPTAGLSRPGTDSFRLYWRRGHGAMPARSQTVRDLGRMGLGRCIQWPAKAGQCLEIEAIDGEKVPFLQADRDTIFIAYLPRDLDGSGRLFVRGIAEPVLILTRL